MSNVFLRESKNGIGVFAAKNIKKLELIIKIKGNLFTYDELPTPYEKVEDYYVQIGEKLYLGPSGEADDYLNHSCDPNSGIKISNGKEVELVAIRDIKKGEEITWDYSTTMAEDEWELDCKCGSRNCRKKIKDFKYLPKKLQEKYIKLGVVPEYVIKSSN